MWLFLSRRLRTWLLITLVVPLASGVLRRIGLAIQQRRGPNALSTGLLRAGELGDRTRGRGGRRRR
jgi:formate hydrogenlyase subunit 4